MAEELNGWCVDCEEWRDVVGFYADRYEISSKGNLRTKPYLKKTRNMGGPIAYWTKSIVIKPANAEGYWQVVLSKDKKRKTIKLHILVAQAFIPNPDNKPQVNHKDSLRSNNCVENLEWATAQENVQHSYDSGSNSNAGDLHPRRVMSEAIVREMRNLKALGKKIADIARHYGLKYHTVQKAISGKNWGHVT